MYNSLSLTKCDHHTVLSYNTSILLQRCPMGISLPFYPIFTPAPGNQESVFCFMNLPCWDVACKCHPAIWGVLCLAAFASCHLLEAPHVVECQYLISPIIHFVFLAPRQGLVLSRYTQKGWGISHGDQMPFQDGGSYPPKESWSSLELLWTRC